MKNNIKFVIPFLTVVLLSSCNDRFDGDEILSAVPVKIDSITISRDTMNIFEVQTIQTFSQYSSGCEGFYGYDYNHSAPHERTVTAYKFTTDASCGNVVERGSQINFKPQEVGTYSFRFWSGKNTSGENIWIEKQVTVK